MMLRIFKRLNAATDWPTYREKSGGGPPRRQAVVSSANAKRHAAPRFCEGSRHCRRHDCDSKAVGDKLHGGLNIAYLERRRAFDAMLRKYFVDKPSEGAVGRQIDEDLLGKLLERPQAARGQWVIAWQIATRGSYT